METADIEYVKRTAEDIYDGWYSDQRIDWEDFLYRVEKYADVDLGEDMDSPLIKSIKKHIREYKKL